MSTSDDADLDPDLEIPEVTDETGWMEGRGAWRTGLGLEIRIDGAVEYSLRITPSNKVVGRFRSTLDVWPAVLAELDRGIPARLLCLDWHDANGRSGPVGSGRLLEAIARRGIRTRARRRVAEAV